MAETMGIDPYLESAAQETLSGSYVFQEENLLLMSRLRGGNVDQLKKNTSEIIAKSEQRIFQLVPDIAADENRKRLMRETALNAAKDFWSKKLEEWSTNKCSNAGKRTCDRNNPKVRRAE